MLAQSYLSAHLSTAAHSGDKVPNLKQTRSKEGKLWRGLGYFLSSGANM